jgi:hypothetical protein
VFESLIGSCAGADPNAVENMLVARGDAADGDEPTPTLSFSGSFGASCGCCRDIPAPEELFKLLLLVLVAGSCEKGGNKGAADSLSILGAGGRLRKGAAAAAAEAADRAAAVAGEAAAAVAVTDGFGYLRCKWDDDDDDDKEDVAVFRR